MSNHEYSQGICGDGAAIFKNGQPMTPEQIVNELQVSQERINVQNEKLNGSDHIPDATKMVQGDVQLMGEVTDEEGNTYSPAMVVEFPTVEDFLAAKKAGQCRFTVFGGDV